MNQTEMLHQMCHSVLSEADVRAICKNRGLPGQAASSRSLLESLFVSDTGVAAALAALDRTEIALLHLLKAIGKPVDVAFFSRLDPPKSERWSYGTFTQRFQGVFSTVKERLVRRGILILALGPADVPGEDEHGTVAVCAAGAVRTPPAAVGRVRETSGRRRGLAQRRRPGEAENGRRPRSRQRDRRTTSSKSSIASFVSGGQPFRAGRLLEWQKRRWQAETAPAKRRSTDGPYTFLPAEAVVHILAGLDAGLWGDVDALAAPLEVFCGFKADGGSVCESGWRWGCLARQESDGKTWYRLAPPPPAADAPPDQYLAMRGDDSVAVDLDAAVSKRSKIW